MNTLQLLYDEMKNHRKMICEAAGCIDSEESYEQFEIECYARLLIADCMQAPYVIMSMVVKNKTVFYPYSKTIKIDDISVSEIVSIVKSWKENFVSAYGKEDVKISVNQAIDYLIKSHEPKKFELTEDYLNRQTDAVISEILRTRFEDGMSNDVARKVESFANQNREITCRWIVRMYEKTLENPAVSEGLLRIIAMIYKEGDDKLLEYVMRLGIASRHSNVQEEALMVCEEWRTKSCLDAIQEADFNSKWIKKYAERIACELEIEFAGL